MFNVKGRCFQCDRLTVFNYCEDCTKNWYCQNCKTTYPVYPDDPNGEYEMEVNHTSWVCGDCITDCKCTKCGESDDSSCILLCDSCHVKGAKCLSCAGLNEVPSGPWFCSRKCGGGGDMKKRPRNGGGGGNKDTAAILDAFVSRWKAMDAIPSTRAALETHMMEKKRLEHERATLDERMMRLTETHSASAAVVQTIEDECRGITLLDLISDGDTTKDVPDLRKRMGAARGQLALLDSEMRTTASMLATVVGQLGNINTVVTELRAQLSTSTEVVDRLTPMLRDYVYGTTNSRSELVLIN